MYPIAKSLASPPTYHHGKMPRLVDEFMEALLPPPPLPPPVPPPPRLRSLPKIQWPRLRSQMGRVLPPQIRCSQPRLQRMESAPSLVRVQHFVVANLVMRMMGRSRLP